MSNIYEQVFYSKSFVTIVYLDSWYIQNINISRTCISRMHSQYRELLKYSLDRILCNHEIFATLAYSSLTIMRTRGILKTLSNMYDRSFSREPCETGYLWWRLLSRATCNPRRFGTQAYSEYCQTSIMKYFIKACVTLTYSEPCFVHNSSIFWNQGMFITLPNI